MPDKRDKQDAKTTGKPEETGRPDYTGLIGKPEQLDCADKFPKGGKAYFDCLDEALADKDA